MTTRARSFDAAAALYGAHRPGYPPALFDAVEALAGRPLAGARVADVGAGTGIATALLRERGAEVLAVEPGDGMAAEFARTHPGIPIVRGDGDRLPLATGAFDLLTYAQAWHWTDPARSVPEARRVLRPGGALAIWWNDADSGVPWIAEQDERLRVFFEAKGVSNRTLPQGSASSPPAPCGGPGTSPSTTTSPTSPATPPSCCWARPAPASTWPGSGNC